jgi:thioredoxin 1
MKFQGSILDVDETNHDNFLKNNLSMLHFFSDWEMDCLMILPIIEGLAEEFNGRLAFGRVNVEEAEAIAHRHNVLKVPSALFFRNGSLIDRVDKIDCEEKLRNKIMCLI